ncbi:MAG TPA: hypothetical protein VHD35_11210 [Chitinophagaceae bacterium]|nr:hypothetical protein [Chitinophagaceae bacterium]
MEKITKEGLLDSAAIIIAPIFNTYDGEVFTSESLGGTMLVTENPKYMRKDLPKYIPQFFVLFWSWEPNTPGYYFRKMMEENFPIEKLQAMIDK